MGPSPAPLFQTGASVHKLLIAARPQPMWQQDKSSCFANMKRSKPLAGCLVHSLVPRPFLYIYICAFLPYIHTGRVQEPNHLVWWYLLFKFYTVLCTYTLQFKCQFPFSLNVTKTLLQFVDVPLVAISVISRVLILHVTVRDVHVHVC